MTIFLGLFLTVLFGFLLTLMINKSLKLFPRLGIAFGLGIGLQSLFMFYMALVRIPLNVLNVSLLLVLLIIILVILNRNDLPKIFKKSMMELINSKKTIFSLNIYEKLLIFYLIFIFLYINWMGFYWPVAVDWDAIALYDFRAKVFSQTGFMDEAIRRGYFFGYPLMTSMAHTWIYLLGSLYPKFIYSFFYTSYFIVFYYFVREFKSRKVSLMVTMLATTSPMLIGHAFLAYTNFPYSYYYSIGLFFLFFWSLKEKNSYLIFAALFIGLSTWVRAFEPFWMVPILFLIIYSLLKKKFSSILIYSLIFFPIQQSWRIYLKSMSSESSNINEQVWQGIKALTIGLDFSTVFDLTKFVFKNSLIPMMPVVLLFVFVILNNLKNFKLKKIKQFLPIFLLIFLNFLVLFVGAYVFTSIWLGWKEIPDSLTRMSIFLVPLLFFTIGLLFKEEKLSK